MKYDIFLVVRPEDDLEALQARMRTLLEKEGFSITEMLSWGKKRLAYPIKKLSEGAYFVAAVTADPSKPKQLNTRFKLEESILRSLILEAKDKKVKKPSRAVVTA